MLRGLASPTPQFSSLHTSARDAAAWRAWARPMTCKRAVERDLDWEPEIKGPLVAPSRSRPPPPPPPPPPRSNSIGWLEAPFSSRRNILLTMLAGTSSLWFVNHQLAPIRPIDKPDVPFNLVGFTDLAAEDFVYFKTRGGNYMAAAKDERGRLFMIDQIGDLYYDSGDPQIGLYAMDTQGNLFNFYVDTDNEQKITPVGNIKDLRKFKISEITGVKLDRDVNVVAFEDGREIPLPPSAGYYNKRGKFVPPGELIEGFTEQAQDRGSFSRMLRGGLRNEVRTFRPERMEVDLQDPAPFSRQLFGQTLLDDPDLPGYQPALPQGFDIRKLAKEVEEEARQGKK